MVNISQALGLPTLFLRFNPDGYADGDGRKSIKLEKRLPILEKLLKKLTTDSATITKYRQGYCRILQIYFDGYTRGNGEFSILTQFDDNTNTDCICSTYHTCDSCGDIVITIDETPIIYIDEIVCINIDAIY